LWEGTTDETRDAVVTRTIHFGVGIWPRPHPELVLVPLFRDLMLVVRGRRAAPEPAPLFFVPRIQSSQRVIDRLRAGGQLPARLVACGDLELVKSLVLHGAGLGVLPWRVALDGTAPGALRPVDATLPFEIELGSLLYRADLHRTRAAMLVHDALLAEGRRLDALELPCGVPSLERVRTLPTGFAGT
jgi:DNA-binding transcriptional LysR family regulator